MLINPLSNINFRARVSEDFKDEAQKYYRGIKDEYQRETMLDNFQAKVDEYKLFGTRDMTVEYKASFKNGKRMHSLYIEQPGHKKILLSTKEQFRKLLEKFMHVNEYEFNTKVEQGDDENPSGS